MPTTASKHELDQLVDLIQHRRDITGESVSSIARRTGMRRATVGEILAGTYPHSPTLEMVTKLSSAFGIRITFETDD